jgi:O-acetylserine/cysteine efflux transporter
VSPILPLRHFLLALAVVTVWGSNFVVITLALTHLPPLLFAALRFTFAFLPGAFFLRRPDVPWNNLALYGLLIGVGQFGLLYIAMNGGISPGIASLVVQTQVFFTIGFSIWLTNDRVFPFQWVALLLAATGIAVIFFNTDGNMTGPGLLLVLVAACSWGGGNVTAKRAGTPNMASYVVWSSVFAIPPLLALSCAFEGPHRIGAALREADAATWAAVAWQGWGNTLFGFAAWGWLLARHSAATVMPMALLVPVFGMSTAALAMGEPLPPWKLSAAALVMAGLAVNLLWARARAVLAQRPRRTP